MTLALSRNLCEVGRLIEEANQRQLEALLSVPLYRIQEGQNPLLLISLHEGRHIPERLHDEGGRPLGISDPSDLDRHIALDLGAGELTTYLAELTNAYVFRVTHSRLVADLNRYDDEEECIAPIADGTEIPLNKSLTEQERRLRLKEFYFPVLKRLNDFMSEVAGRLGSEPFVISMHSYARKQKESPEPKREDICVFGYPEFGTSPNLENFVLQMRAGNPGLIVGNNRPFSARTPGLQASEDDYRLACPVTFQNVVQRDNVLNHFCLEICQDLLKTSGAQLDMAKRVSNALAAVTRRTGSEWRQAPALASSAHG
jgi:predicted N-formylglutamate amidohydrolase